MYSQHPHDYELTTPLRLCTHNTLAVMHFYNTLTKMHSQKLYNEA